MAKFRKKPVVIEAVQWHASLRLTEVPDWITTAMNKRPGDIGSLFRFGDKIQVFTLEGCVWADPGDWIIKGVKGELYPCKPDIFPLLYDAVEE